MTTVLGEIEVRCAIQLDNEPSLRTIKIDNVGTNAMLSAELFTEQFRPL